MFADGQLEYSAFDGGYFDAAGSPHYYITDWQGNNAAVVNSAGYVVQETEYYPYGEPTIEPKGQRYLFGGKEREHAGGRNTYDFGARSLTPYGIWPSPDPLAEKFYPISPYSYCAGDPINRVDKDGREWEIETTQDNNGVNIKMRITGVILNLSSTKLDMDALYKSIKEQLEEVYSLTMEGITVSMSADIKVVESMNDIVVSDHVFTVVDQTSLKGNALASTSGYGIKIGTILAEQTISGDNQRSIAHELGHTGGLHDVKTPKNDLTIDRPDSNLMTQMINLGRGIDKNAAILIERKQIDRLVDNYSHKNRSNNMSPYLYLDSRVKRIYKSLYNRSI